MMPGERPNITNINADVLAYTLSLLDPLSLARASQTCRRLRTAANTVAERTLIGSNLNAYNHETHRLASMARVERVKKPLSQELAQSQIPDELLGALLTPEFKREALRQVDFVMETSSVVGGLKINFGKLPVEMVVRIAIEKIPGPCYCVFETKTYNLYMIKDASGKIDNIKVFRNGLVQGGKTLPDLKSYKEIKINSMT